MPAAGPDGFMCCYFGIKLVYLFPAVWALANVFDKIFWNLFDIFIT